MKIKFIFIAAVFAGLTLYAQTNAVIFPQLLSSTNTVLMTNAEFRIIAIPKIYFRNDAGYRSFYPGELNSNVLAAIGTSLEKLNAQQAKLDAESKKQAAAEKLYAAQVQAQAKLNSDRKLAEDFYSFEWEINHGGQAPSSIPDQLPPAPKNWHRPKLTDAEERALHGGW